MTTSQPRKVAKKATTATPSEGAKLEGAGFVIVEQCGVSLRIPIAGRVPLRAVDAFRNRDTYGGTRALLGDEQWELLSNAGATRDDLDELYKKLNEARRVAK